MQPERRNQIVLLVLVLILAGLIYRLLPPPAVTPSSSSVVAVNRATGEAPSQPAAPDVHLNALEAERPKPSDAERNLFRFKARPLPPPVSRPAPPVAPPIPAGPPPPPPIPPIALKFIGIVEAPERSLK